MTSKLLEQIKENFLNKEKYLSEYATKSSDAIRIREENFDNDIRPNFYHDIDRIIHSLSYTRYLDKTQVFSFKQNDHISKRIVHVQLVSKIARTIGRALNLNEDLIEAIALGHDIGHTPIGHTGEAILNDISLRETGTLFNHNIQSVRNYLVLEKKGFGSNLAIQTLDGIMCHNGEMLSNIYEPNPKTKEEFLEEYEKCYTDKVILKKIRPMTLEGCVVRISDIIGYIGRDIEDAINLGVLTREDVPTHIREVLGTTNKEIVNTIIIDIVTNSYNKPYIKLSNSVYKAIFDLKKFNYEHIYSKANTKEELEFYRNGMNNLFNKYLDDITNKNYDSDIYKIFLNTMDASYIDNTDSKRMVIDYIAGMTDDYFVKKIKEISVNTK
ncbi:MAG: HD domain-containing protein [Tenericutes bacterium]|nr:HD domain-containing protein [Mycoplasmatota bacterium]